MYVWYLFLINPIWQRIIHYSLSFADYFLRKCVFLYTTLKWLLYEKKSEAFAVANRMVVEAMEKRYEQDLQKWNSTPIEKKTKKNKPVKVEFGVRM